MALIRNELFMGRYFDTRTRPADVEAEIRLFHRPKVGRTATVRSGYWRFTTSASPNLNASIHEYVSSNCVIPGASAVAHLWFRIPGPDPALVCGLKVTVQKLVAS